MELPSANQFARFWLLACVTMLLGLGYAQQQTNVKPVTVTLWSWSPVTSTMQAMVQAIEKQHPNIRIRATIEPHTAYFTSLKAAAASGNLPDIIGLSAGAVTQEYRAYLQSLGPIAVTFWGEGWRSNFASALLAQARLGNVPGDHNFYMIPQEAEVINLWYSRAIFKAAGIKLPPKTFNELVTDTQKISAAGFIPFYQGGGTGLFDVWVYMQIAAQTDLHGLLRAENGAAVWTNPEIVAAAKIWRKLFVEHVFQPGALSALQYPTGANLFAAGRVGIISLGSWWLQETSLPGPLPPGIKGMEGFSKFFFPAVELRGIPAPPLGGVDLGWGLTKNAKRDSAVEAAAKVVLKELVSGAGEQVALNQLNDLPAFNGMKPTVELSPHLSSLYSTYIEELQHAYPHRIGNPRVYQALISGLQAIGAGITTPLRAMQGVQKVALEQQSGSH